jgi:hypothetical protein
MPKVLTISWEPVSHANRYHFQLDNNNDFSSPLHDDEVAVTAKEISGLSDRTIYYWRIRALGECTAGDWSDIWKFETAESDPDAITNAIRTRYYLGQNNPNPFTETTNIEFSLPVDDQVSIEILDMQGRMIESYRGYFCAGNHSIELNLKGMVKPGIYLYRMRTTRYTESKMCCIL